MEVKSGKSSVQKKLDDGAVKSSTKKKSIDKIVMSFDLPLFVMKLYAFAFRVL